MKKHLERRARAHSGQALVEFLVATMLATSVLLLGIVMLGKFNDIRNRTLMGSRYAAWERTVWIDAEANDPTMRDWYARYGSGALQVQKSDRQIQSELLARVVAGANAGADGKRLAQPSMWKDLSGAALLDDARDVTVTTQQSDLPSQLDAYTSNGFGSMPTAAGGAPFAASLDLPSHALQSATLRIAAGMHSDALRRLWKGFDGFAVDDTNALLGNTWLPEGAPHAEALFAQSVPAANAALITPSLYQGLRVYAPEIDTLEFGRIHADVVPADRLAR
ncbi:MAG TPA: hypothetical protein VN289_19150 [Paraburkholderia sp.]|jgi:hypothetical protein|nr:hypothetical protein [Paraburkholderia sp.]